MTGVTQIKSDVVGTHQHEFIRVAHFVAFLAKWTKPEESQGGTKSLEDKNQEISLQKSQECQAVFVEGRALSSRDWDRKDLVTR